jgi:hypothetical protein
MPNSARSRVWLVQGFMFGAALAAVSCGGSTPPAAEATPPAASAGDEPEPVAAAEPVTPPPAAAPSGRGSLVVSAQVDGKAVPAQVKLAGDQPIEGVTGEEISAPSGTRQVVVTVTDDKVLLDKPSQTLEVFIEPGKLAKVQASFPWAKVQLNVLVGGRSQPGVLVKLLRGGQQVAELKSGREHQFISPGKYEAEVIRRGAALRVKGLVFLEGAVQTVPIRAQM